MELQQYLPNFQQTQTPFYFYDTELLQRTFQEASQEIQGIENGHIHLALKANNHPIMLQMARTYGMGIDAVSGGEVELAVSAGIPNKKIVFAGVGKTDEEIRYALKHNILCFNVESVPEIEVIQELAQELKCTTNIAIRVNPNVDAHTHQNITTGLEENKFGIALQDLVPTIKRILELPNLNYYGLHFHIGSQILEKEPFIKLCQKINRLQTQLEKQGTFGSGKQLISVCNAFFHIYSLAGKNNFISIKRF